ncbi:MAG: hypothetical protein LBJ39_04510, partial [Tannerellaceae bacterium]|nr:hypothetical protein [Tannerellaceae bacterium]
KRWESPNTPRLGLSERWESSNTPRLGLSERWESSNTLRLELSERWESSNTPRLEVSERWESSNTLRLGLSKQITEKLLHPTNQPALSTLVSLPAYAKERHAISKGATSWLYPRGAQAFPAGYITDCVNNSVCSIFL